MYDRVLLSFEGFRYLIIEVNDNEVRFEKLLYV